MRDERWQQLEPAGVVAIPTPTASTPPAPPPPPGGWKLPAFPGSLDLARTADGVLVISQADRRIAMSRLLLDQLAESSFLRHSDDQLTFVGQDAAGQPCTVTYERVGFDPTDHPAANEGGFHLLQRVEQETP
ncbi:hypothetical protein Ade02nite_19620 [Paractinoplanes deccanensis]|uniref:Uncharacterized protein n=1 Tax=Paractinoplanes deccanensis TaxID=113561 RepID=A0ABQ3XZZ5_9ACTN|nr:hypothetical protein [Actinoplanes deccanensis]GID73321.1 hypothetical protein Ade02nite_19620 [Actinoplanes deccanensis]